MENEANGFKKEIENYQCPGCMCGCDISCFEPSFLGVGCGKHVPGTLIVPGIGRISLGMPKGFNRIGPLDTKDGNMNLYILPHPDEFEYDDLNVVVWKHLDEHGNTLARGMTPRLNLPFLHVLIGDYIDAIGGIDITSKLKDLD